jgi:hypothetical protein
MLPIVGCDVLKDKMFKLKRVDGSFFVCVSALHTRVAHCRILSSPPHKRTHRALFKILNS